MKRIAKILAIALFAVSGSYLNGMIGFSKTAMPTTFCPGDMVTFTIVASNLTGAPVFFRVTDMLPTGLTLINHTEVSANGNTFVAVNATPTSYVAVVRIINQPDTVTITLTCQVAPNFMGSEITNTAILHRSVDGVVFTLIAQSSATITRTSPTITKTVCQNKCEAIFTIIVTNPCGTAINNVVVTDILPAGLMLEPNGVSGTPPWNIMTSGNSITATFVGGLAAKSSTSPLTIKARLVCPITCDNQCNPSIIINTATVTTEFGSNSAIAAVLCENKKEKDKDKCR